MQILINIGLGLLVLSFLADVIALTIFVFGRKTLLPSLQYRVRRFLGITDLDYRLFLTESNIADLKSAIIKQTGTTEEISDAS